MNFKIEALPTGTAYISDKGNGYKVVEYGGLWFAYFKPRDWRYFGNTCSKDWRGNSRTYPTSEEAMQACRHHFERYGANPRPHERI